MIYRVEVLSPKTGKWEGPCRGDARHLPEPGKEHLLQYGENLGLAFGDLVCTRNKIHPLWMPNKSETRFVFTAYGWRLAEEMVFDVIERFHNAKWRILFAPTPPDGWWEIYGPQATVSAEWLYQNAQEV